MFLQLHVSRNLILYLLVLLAITTVVSWQYFQWLAAIVIEFCGFYYLGFIFWKYALLKHSKAIIGIQTSTFQDWELVDRSQKIISAQLYSEVICLPFLVLLVFKATENRQKIPVLIMRDAVSKEEFRQLRVSLKLSVKNI